MPEQPALPRYTSENTGSSLKITIPSKKNWFTIPFLFVWIMGWSFGEYFAASTLIKQFTDGFSFSEISGNLFGSGFLTVWLIGWTLGGGSAIFSILWLIAGKEILEVTGDTLFISYKIMFFGTSKEYSASNISDMRVAMMVRSSLYGPGMKRNPLGVPPGTLSFDYGAKTVNFGSGCEEAEAKMILKEIWQAYPQYKPQ